jgi:hypothetical protein
MNIRFLKFSKIMNFFSKFQNPLYIWTQSGYKKPTCHMAWMFEDLDTKNLQFVCLGRKVDGNVKIYFDIFNTKRL